MITKKFLRNIVFYAVVIALAVVTGFMIYKIYIKDRYTIALNITKSLPDYFYIVDNQVATDGLKNNQTISFKFDIENDRYYEKESNFIKVIKCKEGDFLQNENSVFKCNNKIIGVALPSDSQGMAIESFDFNKNIPKDSYFVMGTAMNSYDSRYWGFVKKEKITGVVIW